MPCFGRKHPHRHNATGGRRSGSTIHDAVPPASPDATLCYASSRDQPPSRLAPSGFHRLACALRLPTPASVLLGAASLAPPRFAWRPGAPASPCRLARGCAPLPVCRPTGQYAIVSGLAAHPGPYALNRRLSRSGAFAAYPRPLRGLRYSTFPWRPPSAGVGRVYRDQPDDDEQSPETWPGSIPPLSALATRVRPLPPSDSEQRAGPVLSRASRSQNRH